MEGIDKNTIKTIMFLIERRKRHISYMRNYDLYGDFDFNSDIATDDGIYDLYAKLEDLIKEVKIPYGPYGRNR